MKQRIVDAQHFTNPLRAYWRKCELLFFHRVRNRQNIHRENKSGKSKQKEKIQQEHEREGRKKTFTDRTKWIGGKIESEKRGIHS